MTSEFLTTTAASPELELLLTDPADGQLVRGRLVGAGVLMVGRLPTADVVLPAKDLHAARMHFRIDLNPGHCLLNNLSEHGTFVNGLLVHTQCDLRNGDLLRVSGSVFVVHLLRRGEPVELTSVSTVLWQLRSGVVPRLINSPLVGQHRHLSDGGK